MIDAGLFFVSRIAAREVDRENRFFQSLFVVGVEHVTPVDAYLERFPDRDRAAAKPRHLCALER